MLNLVGSVVLLARACAPSPAGHGGCAQPCKLPRVAVCQAQLLAFAPWYRVMQISSVTSESLWLHNKWPRLEQLKRQTLFLTFLEPGVRDHGTGRVWICVSGGLGFRGVVFSLWHHGK